MHADIALSASCKKCWAAEFIEACKGLRALDRYTSGIKAATPLPLQDFMVDLHNLFCVVRRELDGADPRTHAHKLAAYHAWMSLPLKPSTARGLPHLLLLPRYLQLELSRHVLRSIARFCLRAHVLRFETGCLQIHNRHCDKCGLNVIQDEKHVLFLCPCLMCLPRRKSAEHLIDLIVTDRF